MFALGLALHHTDVADGVALHGHCPSVDALAGVEDVADGDVGVWRACPVEGLGVLPHQVVVVALGMTLWIERAAVVATVGRKDVAQSDAGIESPLATLAEAVLPAQVQETHDDLELVALALPFQVTIATACCQSDVETIQRVVVLAVAQPVAQL